MENLSGLSTFGVCWTLTQAYDYVEFFAGRGWVTECMAASGRTTAKFDILLGNPQPQKQDAMDLTSPSGFWFPGLKGVDANHRCAKFFSVSAFVETHAISGFMRVPSLGTSNLQSLERSEILGVIAIAAPPSFAGAWPLNFHVTVAVESGPVKVPSEHIEASLNP